ncbi:MAG: MFS transporter [Actinobacteria bacterium]|nr:MFS transporter [Actinomycetota bacterium]
MTPLKVSVDFRRIFFSQLVSQIGTQMTAVVIILQIFDISRSNFATGLVGAVAFVPMVVGGLYGGSIADARDRRAVAYWTTSALAGVSLIFAGIAYTDLRVLWPLYLLIVGQTWLSAIAQPTRMAIIPRLVGAELLPAANALAQISWNIGFTIGPVIGATIAKSYGFGWAYLVDAISFGGAVYAYWRLPPVPPDGAAGHKAGFKSVLEGLKFLKGRDNVSMTFYVDIVAMAFGMQRVLFASIPLAFYGLVVVGLGPVNVSLSGLLFTAPALGAVIGAVGSGWFSRVRRQGLAVVISILVWGGAICLFGLTHQWWLGLLFLAVAGAADMVSAVFRNTILQAATPDAMRGRLQGVLIAVVAGGPYVGDFRAGAIAEWFDVRLAVVSGGILCIVGVLALVAWRPGFLRYDAWHPVP